MVDVEMTALLSTDDNASDNEPVFIKHDFDSSLLEDDDRSDLDLDRDEERPLRCGYFSWTPACLQRCNRPSCLLACVCWFTFVQGKAVCCLLQELLRAAWLLLYIYLIVPVPVAQSKCK